MLRLFVISGPSGHPRDSAISDCWRLVVLRAL